MSCAGAKAAGKLTQGRNGMCRTEPGGFEMHFHVFKQTQIHPVHWSAVAVGKAKEGCCYVIYCGLHWDATPALSELNVTGLTQWLSLYVLS